MATLEKAIATAVRAHFGQTDKQGLPYILHPLSVMQRVRAMVGSGAQYQHYLMVAVLHDVVEDTNITLGELRELGFSEEVVQGVDSVTKREGENYITFVRRSYVNPIGRIVKLADVQDNHERIPTHLNSKWWAKLATKYAVALHILRDDRDWLQENAELVAGMETA